uniref:Uncharacterized protein n=2 Tax=Oryza TaxID=4527 RepID=A0A0D3F6S5_9ORYZ
MICGMTYSRGAGCQANDAGCASSHERRQRAGRSCARDVDGMGYDTGSIPRFASSHARRWRRTAVGAWLPLRRGSLPSSPFAGVPLCRDPPPQLVAPAAEMARRSGPAEVAKAAVSLTRMNRSAEFETASTADDAKPTFACVLLPLPPPVLPRLPMWLYVWPGIRGLP